MGARVRSTCQHAAARVVRARQVPPLLPLLQLVWIASVGHPLGAYLCRFNKTRGYIQMDSIVKLIEKMC